MVDRRCVKRESVNRSLTVSPRHAPLTRGLNVKPRPFLGWAARFCSPFYQTALYLPSLLSSNTVLHERKGEERGRPLHRFSIGLSKQRLVLTFIVIIAVISAVLVLARRAPRKPRTCRSWDCRRIVGWLHGAASSRDRDLLREPVPLVLLLDRHRLVPLTHNIGCSVNLFAIGRSSFAIVYLFFTVFICVVTRCGIEGDVKKESGNLGACSIC